MSLVPDAPLPEDIRRFVLTSIPSVPFVEALLLFRESHDPIDVAYVARHLYISGQASGLVVAQLQDARIVEAVDARAGLYRYAPRDDELASMLDRLAPLYATHLVEISRLIHSQTERAAHQFADAFKLRKDG